MVPFSSPVLSEVRSIPCEKMEASMQTPPVACLKTTDVEVQNVENDKPKGKGGVTFEAVLVNRN